MALHIVRYEAEAPSGALVLVRRTFMGRQVIGGIFALAADRDRVLDGTTTAHQ